MNTQTTQSSISATNKTVEYVEDSIAYFMDALQSDLIYTIRLHRTDRDNEQESIIYLVDSYATQWRKVETSRASMDALILYVKSIETDLKAKDGVKIDYWNQKDNPANTILTIKKKSRKSSSALFKQGINPAVYNFVEKAYTSGVNILIVGQTGQGKTGFLNTLMDSSKDYTPTVVASYVKEMMFGSDHSEIVEIVGNYNAAAAHALNMNIPRVVIDDVIITEEMIEFMGKRSEKGTQYVVTGHGLPLSLAETGEAATCSFVEWSDKHPFDIEVDIALKKRADGKGRDMVIVGVHELITEDGTTSLRTLFSGNEFIQDPTRHIRRKMEGKTRGIKHDDTRFKLYSPPLVASDEEEIGEVMAHQKALGEFLHEANAYEALAHFNEVDKFLSKFQ